MVLIQVLNDKLEEFWKVVNTGFILDGEQKESIKQHFLASKSVPSDFWSALFAYLAPSPAASRQMKTSGASCGRWSGRL